MTDSELRSDAPGYFHGYVCKRCGKPSPNGVGYVAPGKEAAQASAGLTACECGYSLAVDKDGYIILTPALAKVASETLADVATPGGSLGVVSKVKGPHVWVNVSSPQSDEIGDHRYDMSSVSVSPGTVDYWRRQGYID